MDLNFSTEQLVGKFLFEMLDFGASIHILFFSQLFSIDTTKLSETTYDQGIK